MLGLFGPPVGFGAETSAVAGLPSQRAAPPAWRTLRPSVIKGLVPGEPADRRCTSCTDYRKDQVIIGMTIVSGMHKEGDGWEGGQILDPDNGKVYRCKMHLEKDGRELVVRGYIGVSLLGRSQSWIRQTPLSSPH